MRKFLMLECDELFNFNNNRTLSNLPKGTRALLYDIYLGKENPDQKYEKIMEVIKHIVMASDKKWPTDEEWRSKFTDDFNQHLRDYTREECLQMMANKKKEEWGKLPWDFGSWIDVIHKRTWRWLAHERKSLFLTVALSIKKNHENELKAFDEVFVAFKCKIIRKEWVLL